MNCPKCNLETESMLEIIAISCQGFCFTCEKTNYQITKLSLGDANE